MPLIVVCRFIPGGRTAVTLCCGIVRYDQRRFVIATAIAGVIWASYSFFIGRLGGKAFEDKPWAGLLLALGIAVAISLLIELVRRIRSRGAQALAAAEPATEQGTAPSPGRAPRPYDVDAASTSYERHGWDIHALGVAGGGYVPSPQWYGRCGMGASLSCWSMSTRIASPSILQA
jgi:hypothetical protein